MSSSALLMSGAGDLGIRILRRLIQGNLWKNLRPNQVVCETLTGERHARLQGLEFQTRFSSEAPVSCDALVIAFPPGPDYPQQVNRALAQWNKKGPALLVSSTGVYSENEGNWIDEKGALKKDSLQIQAEDLAFRHGAHVVRLGGLYTKETGPQIHWQKLRKVEVSPSVFVNLIHRHDAADAIARLLVSKQAPSIWNLADTKPVRRFDIDQAWSKHIKAGPARFLDMDDPGLGKKIRSDKIFHALDWQPRWKSFIEFVGTLEQPRNVLGGTLKSCCLQPVTGFARNGFCRSHSDDVGGHVICAEMTDKFLQYSKSTGNDLSTPRPELHFVGLRAGDKWCLCASRWVQALEAGAAPRIYIESTDESMIEWIEPEILKTYALDLA